MVPRSDVPGHPASEGVLTSLPFVPTGAAPDAVGPLGELRGGRDGPRAAAELYAAHPGVRAYPARGATAQRPPGRGTVGDLPRADHRHQPLVQCGAAPTQL